MKKTIAYRIPARFVDNANYGLSNLYVPQIHLLIDFEGRIDTERLSKALRLSLDAEPILGCRYVPRWIRPYWVRMEELDIARSRLLKENAGDELILHNSFNQFLSEPVYELQGPQLKSMLLRREKSDKLVVKLNHQVVDAGGAKEFGYLLALFYRMLGGNPRFRPLPNRGTRSMRQVYNSFSKRFLFHILCRHFIELRDNMVPYKSITYPSGTEKKGTYSFVLRRLSEERVGVLKAYCSKKNATLNDLMVAALLRACVRQTEWRGEGALRMAGTVDLRRYLPDRRAKALCNLSSFYFLNLGYNLGAQFDDTVSNVKTCIEALKSDSFGLSFAFGNYVFTLPYPFALKRVLLSKVFPKLVRTGNIPPSMTNMGAIDDKALDFGFPRVSKAEVIVPPCCPPFLLAGLSGYKDTLTLSVGFFESAIPRKKLEELFALVDQELPR